MAKEGREGLVKWFSELSNKDIAVAGGKGASLAEMYNAKFPVPPGFIITAQAYSYFIDSAGIRGNIASLLHDLDIENTNKLDNVSKKIRSLIENSELPGDLHREIVEAYDILDVDEKPYDTRAEALAILRKGHEPPFVAVRSSATTEDLADASFAGQQDSFLGVKGNEHLITFVKRCFSSLFTPRAIYYRIKKGFDATKSELAVVVQKMIDSDKSGVMFSKNPLANDGMVVIEAVWGLGEGIVSGTILPDHYEVDPKENYDILDSRIADKKIAMVRNSAGEIITVKLTPERSNMQVLTGHELKRLAQYGIQLETHYKKPQDIEFAIANGNIYIVQSRPITTKVKAHGAEVTGNVLLSGLGASPGLASGTVRIIDNLEDLGKVRKGDILVTKMTNPDMVVAMQRAAGIVTDEGGITSHASIVSREMGIPAVVGTRFATEKLKDGEVISVDGFTGRVIEGKVQEKIVHIDKIVPTKTEIKVILDLPQYSARAAEAGAKAIGLVRLEGIIASSGKHPLYFVKKDKMKDYVEVIARGLREMAGHFSEMWVRTSDIRSDEYRNLEGAPEMVEGNPMLGDHGIRFSVKNMDVLESEFLALKELADEFPNKHFGIMMPQVISVSEVEQCKKLMGTLHMPHNVVLGIMVETPAAVQIIDELCSTGIHFASIGSNDLTQYTLAIDRNNSEVQNLYDEMHPAVLRSIAQVLSTCRQHGVKSSLCGQAGSREEMVKFLVSHGIDSISVNADAAHNISKVVAEVERNHVSVNPENSGGFNRREEQREERQEHISRKRIDEETLILKALEGEEIGADEYLPGFAELKDDIPSLNDAIPISSEQFAPQDKRNELVLDKKKDNFGENELTEDIISKLF